MSAKRYLHGWVIAVIDVLLIGAGLCVFSYFHHVRSHVIEVEPSEIVRVTPTPVAATSKPSTDGTGVAATPTPDPGLGGGKFAAMFLSEGAQPEWGEHSYKSRDVRVTIEQVLDGKYTYYVADVYIRSIDNFKTAFARGKYGKSLEDTIKNMAAENNAILAINGDFYGFRTSGIVIRNAKLYRDTRSKFDVCVLYSDGVMETYDSAAFDVDVAVERGAYQAWAFGPRLLDENGAAITDFSNSSIQVANPRTGIGYYEPGHYCFVVIDGRQPGYAVGMTLEQMAKIFESLGCKSAYNLDGGQTSAMVFNGAFANQPYKGGRGMSDIVYIGEVE